MNFKKRIILFLSIILFFGCNDLKNRYDPVEASRNIFQMKEFGFYTSENGVLPLDAEGIIDNSNYTVTIPYPPSEDLSTLPLIARIQVENIGLDGGGDFEFTINQLWDNSPTIKMSPEDYGYEYIEEPIYKPEYDIIMQPQFKVELINTSPNLYFNSGDLTFDMYFNDDAGPAITDPSGDQFRDGFGYHISNNFVFLLNTNIYSNTAASDLPAGGYHYSVTMTPSGEGYIPIQFAANSVVETLTSKGNEASNKLIYIYDYTSPSTGSITIEGLDVSPATSKANVVLKISFPPASDLYTNGDELVYNIFSSATSGTPSYSLLSNTEYKSEYIFTYDDMDLGTQGLLMNGNIIYIIVTVRDLASNQSQFESSQVYTGSSS